MARDVNKWANQFVKGCLRKRPYHSPEEARQKAKKIAKASGWSFTATDVLIVGGIT